ncbi:penicillin acylase family protein [Danxiaibacter flavus]|uniref:Penicillin acylase family protein n=1 Tax=Danxiaibacter flavus TaxID=3049108 RepID=A0ABV3ZQ60_9BACT|nr:penicillin acylase family protein [Chitinophagaceae bacterium DXS]
MSHDENKNKTIAFYLSQKINWLRFVLATFFTVLGIFILNSNREIRGHYIPSIGKLISPSYGFWQNAEPENYSFNTDVKLYGLANKVKVYLDDRLVPHIFSEREDDAYMVQGYLHAMFRLWQMEFITYIASGRASEILGKKALAHDREFRRLGMVYAAENSLALMNSDPASKAQLDAYTAGVNAYITTLKEKDFPLEYKILGYKPEKWTNLKTVLFLKYMCYDLAGADNDFEMTIAKNFFQEDDLDRLFPVVQDSLDPVIPAGTKFKAQKVFPVIPKDYASVYLASKDPVEIKELQKPAKDNGSNNWAVSGKRTRSGAPILCNDPHLQLSLPSIWFEMQITTPVMNVYGVSFPGLPGIIIGFNDSCAFGFTNGERDVRDYYEIRCKDKNHSEYWFNDSWKKTRLRLETIKIRGRHDIIDSVSYVQLGNAWCPIMYDETFGGGKSTSGKCYAVRWTAHDPSNELKAFNGLNHAANYSDYNLAIANLHTPGQNCVFACKNGDIAIYAQGAWPAKWKYQGDFIMPGFDNSYQWEDMIPQDETPFQYNPERGYVSSANQKPVNEISYPYYLGRDFALCRGKIINQKLAALHNITPEDMMNMQSDTYNLFAAMARPLFLKNIQRRKLNEDEKKCLKTLEDWDLRDDVRSQGATVFEVFWNNFYTTIYDDEYAGAPKGIMHPQDISLLEGVLKDTSYKFIDNITTDKKETLSEEVTVAFQKAAADIKKLNESKKIEWGRFKNTQIVHLMGLPSFGRKFVPVGGNSNSINVSQANFGQSWKMIVSLTKKTEAYGIYPGGQSGNPGSKFYDDFIDTWIAGKYYKLWLMQKNDQNDEHVKWKMNFDN